MSEKITCGSLTKFRDVEDLGVVKYAGTDFSEAKRLVSVVTLNKDK